VHLQHEVLQSGALERDSPRGAPGGEGEHAQGVASRGNHVAVWCSEGHQGQEKEVSRKEERMRAASRIE